jgi:hypothetical protein
MQNPEHNDDAANTLQMPSKKKLWADLCRLFDDPGRNAATEVLKGIAVLRVKVIEPHGNFMEVVKKLQSEGRLARQAPTTMRKARRTAESYLDLSSITKPTLKYLRNNPGLLYSQAVTKPEIQKMLTSWGCSFATALRAKAAARNNGTGKQQLPVCTGPFSLTKIKRIRKLCAHIHSTAKDATPAEKDEIAEEARILLLTLRRLLDPPEWSRPRGPAHYQI